ncbi:hypothetical protein GXW83_22730 [Streptacidiphilus sp. PB12-B1b]|uniref:hypothetical protein n=1 Tax=Streptacidiphilus sp. PB12-B1b TaxID=2705012 RepID=UPI0015F8D951|nr:hypothetical protein [Streptacidiphilus sp. PB12-B1b]QMU78092.1 hypothetical protein GXW83_22730 [Streptacidiphilus sp. PB12-B1b]
MTITDVRLFAYRQGQWRGRLNEQPHVDDSVPTTATLPPAAARGVDGRPLPLGTAALLSAARYPQTPACPAAEQLPPGDRLGHLLVAALGLQRREPSNRFNDHRSIASVRSKFPVHAFVVAPDGSTAYLDLYRHALVGLPLTVAAGGELAALLPAPGDATVLLAARYTDLPTPYGRLRCALGLLELGVNLRSLHVAADLLDVTVRQRWHGDDVAAAGLLVAGSGPGAWTPPLVLTLEGVGPLPEARPLPHSAEPGPSAYAEEDARLRQESENVSILDSAEATGPLTELTLAAAEPARGVPGLPVRDTGTARLPWAQALWNRTAGRTPVGVSGFSTRPVTLGDDALADLLAWSSLPAPEPLAAVGRAVRTTVALQRIAGLPTGRYDVVDGRLEAEQADPGLMQALEDSFSYPLSPVVDCGLRHATAMWVFSADLDAILDAFGPAGWSLLQLWCGWATHGVATAAAAHGLFARPARSFEEYRMQYLMGLPKEVVPVFSVTCGRSRFAEPMLDLRT